MPKRYDFKNIEAKWQRFWLQKKVYEPKLLAAKKPFYNLMMFPYPSAEGLHVGNMYAFAGSDIYGRYQRMRGKDVFQPIGLDGFGIHSENYALKIGTHPMTQAKVSEKRFYEQLRKIGNGFAWEEHLETYDPEYYRWTQWLFAQMFRKGLAYRKKQAVNWCPSCKTVLADEQVIAGECERCGSKVEKRELEQWFFKITDYAERLLGNLDGLDWSERVKIAQKNWIGKSEGAEISFPLAGTRLEVKVFTTRPDTLFGATYLVLAPEHPFVAELKARVLNWPEVEAYVRKASARSETDRIAEGKEKTGVELKGVKAVNPATREEIPVWVADYVLASYGTGAIMAVPAHDERDQEFARKFELKIVKVVAPPAIVTKIRSATEIASGAQPELRAEAELWVGDGELVNSDRFTGMDSEKAKWEIVKYVNGKRRVQYRLRDWLISRQRYWGAPIPMIHCAACAAAGSGERADMPGWYAVPDKDLPVKLPKIDNFRPTGTDESPLAAEESFHKVRCPGCKGWARRETDVSDTFLDSAWYYLRYPSVREKKRIWNPAVIKKWFPVDMYIGGAEHSVLHLLYVRFVAMVLKDWDMTHFEEPFKQFRAHGLLIKEGSKMSKSKGNVVNPDEYIQNFGADTLRMYLMFLAPFEQGGDFRDEAVMGITRFLERVWKLGQAGRKEGKVSPDLERHLHRTIKKVTEDIESLHYNTAISALMVILTEMEKHPVLGQAWPAFLKLLAPFAPHLTEELWQTTVKKGESIHLSAWPKANPKLLEELTLTLVIQVNGKIRDSLIVPAGVTEAKAKAAALASPKVQPYLEGKEPKRVIYVPGRVVNIVI